MPQPARNLILLLLNRNPAKRLGANSQDASEIKAHEFFEGIDWEKVEKRLYPVIVPKVKQYTPNPKSVKDFFEELAESEKRFSDY